MIPELASLKNGIARAVLQKDMLIGGIPTRNLKKKKFYEINTLLEKPQSVTMFKILDEIFSINLSKVNEEYSLAKSGSKSKKKDKDTESNQSIELNFLDDEANEMNHEENGFNMSGTNYSAHSETYLDKSTSNAKFDNDK